MRYAKHLHPLQPTEHQLQSALIAWARPLPEIGPFLFAIPNGGARSLAEGVKFKREGVSAGVPDLVFTRMRGSYGAMWIEMKSASYTPRENQLAWHDRLRNEGYYVIWHNQWEQVAKELLWYVSLK